VYAWATDLSANLGESSVCSTRSFSGGASSAGWRNSFRSAGTAAGFGLRCRYKVARDFPSTAQAAVVPIASSIAGKCASMT